MRKLGEAKTVGLDTFDIGQGARRARLVCDEVIQLVEVVLGLRREETTLWLTPVRLQTGGVARANGSEDVFRSDGA